MANEQIIKPSELKNKKFQSSGRGSYRSEDVDSFMVKITAAYDDIYNQNRDFIKKLSLLATKVEEYKKDEDNIKNALVSADKLRASIIEEANAKAKAILTEAESSSEKIKNEADAYANELKEKADRKYEDVVSEVKKTHDEELGKLQREITAEELRLDTIKRDAASFKEKLIAMYKDHVEHILNIPAYAAPSKPIVVSEEKPEEKPEEKREEPIKDVSNKLPEAEITEQTAELQNEKLIEKYNETASEQSEKEQEETPIRKEEPLKEDIASEKESDIKLNGGFSMDMSGLDLSDEEDEIPEIKLDREQIKPAEEIESEKENKDESKSAFMGFFRKK